MSRLEIVFLWRSKDFLSQVLSFNDLLGDLNQLYGSKKKILNGKDLVKDDNFYKMEDDDSLIGFQYTVMMNLTNKT